MLYSQLLFSNVCARSTQFLSMAILGDSTENKFFVIPRVDTDNIENQTQTNSCYMIMQRILNFLAANTNAEAIMRKFFTPFRNRNMPSSSTVEGYVTLDLM